MLKGGKWVGRDSAAASSPLREDEPTAQLDASSADEVDETANAEPDEVAQMPIEPPVPAPTPAPPPAPPKTIVFKEMGGHGVETALEAAPTSPPLSPPPAPSPPPPLPSRPDSPKSLAARKSYKRISATKPATNAIIVEFDQAAHSSPQSLAAHDSYTDISSTKPAANAINVEYEDRDKRGGLKTRILGQPKTISLLKKEIVKDASNSQIVAAVAPATPNSDTASIDEWLDEIETQSPVKDDIFDDLSIGSEAEAAHDKPSSPPPVLPPPALPPPASPPSPTLALEKSLARNRRRVDTAPAQGAGMTPEQMKLWAKWNKIDERLKEVGHDTASSDSAPTLELGDPDLLAEKYEAEYTQQKMAIALDRARYEREKEDERNANEPAGELIGGTRSGAHSALTNNATRSERKRYEHATSGPKCITSGSKRPRVLPLG